MARRTSHNPFAFTTLPVTVWTTIVFIALFAALLATHNVVPSAPSNHVPTPGVNLTEAWLDLQFLTNGFHPYNSRRNDVVRSWLLARIEDIARRSDALRLSLDSSVIIVYIRGTEDEPGDWWKTDEYQQSDVGSVEKYGVLVNAHYDSVPSGYGATDDGVGVVSILQLISYFTHPDHTPARGIVALLNNGEEDYLNGAYAFSQHPMSKFPHSFLNLEGAGAGGRAILFRSTDEEVTEFYKRSPYPTGLVISADGFKRRLVRSDTDYSVFASLLGMRGLDVAFMQPRSRYHTNQDSARYTSIDSIWHMLSAALATMQGLSSDTSSTFKGEAAVDGGVDAGSGSEAVWFDVFGRTFAVFQLHTLFAISVTLLVVTPLILIALHVILARTDRWYLFSRKKILAEDEEAVHINGLRGFFRFPTVVVVSTAACVGLAFLITKVNPYICYSSEYAVWA